jgi:hypothetical protein
MIRIVTAYTPDYAELALRLRDSAKAFGVPITAVPFDSRGSWAKNHMFKPQAILRVMTETGDDCLWLDADMYLRGWPQEWTAGDVLLKYSDPPEAQVFDFARRVNVPNSKVELTPWGGHILFRQTLKPNHAGPSVTQGLLQCWAAQCKRYAGMTNDEQCLMTALKVWSKEITVGVLDPFFIVHTPAGREHGKPTAAEGWL